MPAFLFLKHPEFCRQRPLVFRHRDRREELRPHLGGDCQGQVLKAAMRYFSSKITFLFNCDHFFWRGVSTHIKLKYFITVQHVCYACTHMQDYERMQRSYLPIRVYAKYFFFKKIDLFQLTQKSTPKTVVEFRFFLFTWCPPRSLTLHPSVAVAPRGTRVRLPFREGEDSSKEGEGGEGGAGAVEGPENCGDISSIK